MINNACATQAILSILMNCSHSDLKLGQTLGDLKEFCCTFDAQNKGLALSNASQIRAVHNSFARQTLFELDNKKAAKDEDVFHFIGYVPIDGRLYELDGLKEGPIDLGAIPPNQDWVGVVRPIIQKRIDKYSEGEIHFNLMALVSDRQLIYQRTIDGILSGTSDNDMDTDTKQVEVARLRSLIEDDMAKKKQYKVGHKTHSKYRRIQLEIELNNCCISFQIENIRRKHNYLPFIVELLKMLAEQGQLLPIYEKAKQRAIEREQQQANNKAK